MPNIFEAHAIVCGELKNSENTSVVADVRADGGMPSLKSRYLGQLFSTIERATDFESSDHASERRYQTVTVAPRGVRGEIAC